MGERSESRTLIAFAVFACRYWLLIFPLARREVRAWHSRAATIPDPALRKIALDTLDEEHWNLEGAAAFAVFVPRRRRAETVQTLVTFQAIFDYVDSLAEQPAADPVANGRTLHEALHVALAPGRAQPNYYALHPRSRDGGYLPGLVDRCRDSFQALPCHDALRRPLHRAVRRMIEYQTLIHGDGALAHAPLASWARGETPPGTNLRWWETAAGGASSLVAFAFFAAAARPTLPAEEIEAIEHAYFPWIGSLHVLLDSLIDWPKDAQAGHHSLVENYACPHETAQRIETIATEALGAIHDLPDAKQHALFLAAMACFYLSAPSAELPHARDATMRVATTLGDLAGPVLLVHRARRTIERILAPISRRSDIYV